MPNRSATARSPKSRSDPPSVVAIDLGATKVVSALVAADGTVRYRGERTPHANDGPEGVLAAVLRCARACLAAPGPPPTSVGIAVAAQVDPEAGTVVYAPNLRWAEFPLGPRVSRELGLPTRIVNDARAATLAEWRLGAGRGLDDIFCLSLGTGVGGSAVVGGRLAEGYRYAAGEIGHLTIVAGGRWCHCPNRGCLEAYVGGWAIAERAREAVAAAPSAGRELVARAGSPATISARTVFEAASAGDPLATRLVEETDAYLADGAVGIANAFNPARLILTGGLAVGRPAFVPFVQNAVRARCQPPAASAEVVAGRFGEESALIGAALAGFVTPSPPRPA
ncbi:MAG: ROK family protein [Thermoplasmata archaeon]